MSTSSPEGSETPGRVPELTAHQLGAMAIGGNLAPAGAAITELLPGDLIRESLVAQLPATYAGYSDVMLGLYLNSGVERVTTDVHALENQFKSWFSPAKIQFARAWHERDPAVRFVLTATPNITVDAEGLYGLTKLFSKDTEKDLPLDSIYQQQSPSVLCKADPVSQQPVSLSLVATKYFPTTSRQMDKQTKEFARLRRHNPGIKIPSALEALTYARTLHAHGAQLHGPEAFDLTATRHIDADLKRDGVVRGWRGRPFTFVNMDGQYSLGASSATGLAGLRIAIS